MKLKLYQIDAFSNKIFKGNPAAVIPLKKWLPDKVMQNIAVENNLSETAFFIKESDVFCLRWFTPAREVNLCGHATLATAYVLFELLGYSKDIIRFSTKSGLLSVKKDKNNYIMDFPAVQSFPVAMNGDLKWLKDFKPVKALKSKQDIMIVLSSEREVQLFNADWNKANFSGHRGLIVTSRSNNADFVSRCFYPEFGVDEDPVTGSAHCQLAPYWAKILHKNILNAKQLSKRGGVMTCEVKNERVYISGTAVLFLKGEVVLP